MDTQLAAVSKIETNSAVYHNCFVRLFNSS